MIEQRFNKGKVTFDRCVFAAPARPLIADNLVDIHALGGSSLEVEIVASELHDNAGSAVTATASGTANLVLTIADSALQHLGTGGVTLKAIDDAHATLAMARVQITAPAAPVVVDAAASGTAALCADLAANAFSGGRPPRPLAPKDPHAALNTGPDPPGPAPPPT